MQRCLALFSAVAVFACGGSPTPKPETPAPQKTVEIRTETTSVASESSKPASKPDLPSPEDGWFKRDKPCPEGSELRGAMPPDGLSLTCKRGEQNHGGQVTFYPSGKVQQQGLNRNGERFGHWVGYYEDGTVQYRASYNESGRNTGEELYYYASGRLSSRATYDNGQPTGTWTSWYETGAKASETPYKNGLIHGTAISWRDNGVPMYSAEYVDGVAEGPQISYYDNGKKLYERMYSKGEMHGMSRQWSSTGKLLGSFEMDHGLGTYTEWWESGKKRYSITYTAKGIDGAYNEWHENGQVATKGQYREGSPVGDWLDYTEAGELRTKRTYSEQGTIEIGFQNGKKKTYVEYTRNNTRIEGQFENGKRQGEWKQYDEWNDLRKTEIYKAGKLKKTVEHERPALPAIDTLMVGLEVCDTYIRRAFTCPQMSYYEKRSLSEMVTWWKQSLASGSDADKAYISETCRSYSEFSAACNGKR